MRALPTKHSSVLGIPIGRRRTDWARLGKLGAVMVGAVSTAVGGVGAKRAGDRLKKTGSEQAPPDEETAENADEAGDRAPSGDGGGGGEMNVKKLRHIIKESIEVGVPVETAYNQWTQFTEFPAVMKGPQNVEQEADDEVRWVAKIGPSRRRWTAKIVEQVPDERIVWESTDGTENRGAVTFHELDRNLTRVQVEMEYFPHGVVEKVGNVFLAARRRTRKDLRLFKHFLELEGSETGAWRGEIWTGEEEQDAEAEAPEEGTAADRRKRPARAESGPV